MNDCNVCSRVYTLRYRTKREAMSALRALRAFRVYPFQPETPPLWVTQTSRLTDVTQCVGCRCWLIDRERDVDAYERWASGKPMNYARSSILFRR